MRRQVVYLATGPSYLHYLVPSIRSLRRHWDGDVVVYAWTDRGRNKGSFGVIERIAEDGRLGVEVVRCNPEYRGRNATFEYKPIMMQENRADVGLFIDSDTLVCGPVDPIFSMAERCGFAATQFCDWTTKTSAIRNRIANLRKCSDVPQNMVEAALNYEWPSVNTGVFACRPSSPVLPTWHRWTVDARGTFIPDEVTLHVAMPLYWPSGEFKVVTGNGRYNCSPKFKPKGLPDGDVVIWHFHRHGCSRPDTVDGVKMDGNKSQKGWELWWPEYVECLRENVGFIQDWRHEVGNRWIRAIENVTGDVC